jgi:hypothetical protein
LRNDAKRAGEAESDTFRLSMTGGDAAERDIGCSFVDADAMSLRAL